MRGEALAALLARRVDALAAAGVARLGARVAGRWSGHGVVTRDGDTVRLLAPGVRQRRRGSRNMLAQPDLLWPAVDLGDGS